MLLIYSWKLTLIVLTVSAIAFMTLAVMSREFRLKLREVNDIEGRRKAFLFEILNGIDTIKTLALEPRSMLRWRRFTDQTRSDRDTAAAQLSKPRLRHRLAVLRAPQRPLPNF